MPKTKRASRKESVHSGHRNRMKEQYLVTGGKELNDHELLEMLLFYSMPRIDTNELAHRLINEFGSLRDVIYAPTEKLMKVKGIGKNTAILLSLICDSYRRINLLKLAPNTKFDTLTSIGELLLSYFRADLNERLCAAMFDGNMKLIGIYELSCGYNGGSKFDINELIRLSVIRDAAKVVLAHNHPSGNRDPSTCDRLVTSNAQKALNALNIELVEHIIVSEIGYSPMMQGRLLTFSQMDDSSPYVQFYKYFYSH